MESRMSMDVAELRSELEQILKTEPTRHPSKPLSIITASTLEAGRLQRTFPDSLAARLSMSPGFCQEGATKPEMAGRTERWEEVATWLFRVHGVSVFFRQLRW